MIMKKRKKLKRPGELVERGIIVDFPHQEIRGKPRGSLEKSDLAIWRSQTCRSHYNAHVAL